MGMKFAHTMIRVVDIEKSLQFYKELIGLKLSRTMELEDATLYFLTDENESCSIELTHNHEIPEGGYRHGNYFGHLAFVTDNMNAFSSKLKEYSVEYAIAPFDVRIGGPKIAFVEDPDGIAVEIIERKTP